MVRRAGNSYLKTPLVHISHLKGSKVLAKRAANTRQYSIMMGFAWGFKPTGKVPQEIARSQSASPTWWWQILEGNRKDGITTRSNKKNPLGTRV